MKKVDALLHHIVRIPGVRGFWRRHLFGPAELRAQFDIWERPHYGYGVWETAQVAKMLGMPRMSVCEFGVAAGRGLMALERIAAEVESSTGVGIDVFGFDSGRGLPPPADYRDVPHYWSTGDYQMDVDGLKSRLQRAHLVLGDVKETVPAWAAAGHAPLAFAAFDLDFYSSTMQAFRIFDGPASSRLPRVMAYFDDMIHPPGALLNEYVGEELAIREFNEKSATMKICKIRGLSYIRASWSNWHDQMYCLHDFAHPLYTANVAPHVYRQRLRDEQVQPAKL